MEHRYLFIGRWDVDFYFAVDGYDVDEILPTLYDMGIDDDFLDRAIDIMEHNYLNTGFVCIDKRMKQACIVIGPTSSGEEFIDTVVHEIHHLAVAIADVLGVDLEGETPAYLSGDSARELAEIICELGCSRCR